MAFKKEKFCVVNTVLTKMQFWVGIMVDKKGQY